MFERLEEARQRKMPRWAVISAAAHALVILLVAVVMVRKEVVQEIKPVEVKFKGPGNGPGAPPPPPPPPGGHKTKPHKVTPKKVEIPKVIETPKPQPVEPPKVEKKEEPEEPAGQEGGVKGGVEGGVAGGVENGQVGGIGGGGNVEPPPPPKAKNVPAFVLKKDEINVPPPRMTEVFKLSHRGQRVSGSYKVCVGMDGHVYDVIPATSIPGADEAFIEQIKSDWLYKPQKVPACFLYNANITVE